MTNADDRVDHPALLKQLRAWQQAIATQWMVDSPSSGQAPSHTQILTHLCRQLWQDCGLPVEALIGAIGPDTWADYDDIPWPSGADGFPPGSLPIELLGQIYDKRRGDVHYTPKELVDYIVQQTVHPTVQLHLTILDPACGGGVFLLSSYEYLLDVHLRYYLNNSSNASLDPPPIQMHQGQWQLTPAERERILLDSIYGVDIDAQAIAITQLSLLLKLRSHHPSDRPLPDLSRNIQTGNAIALDWSTAFPTCHQAGGFDVVLGNPPYMDSETMIRQHPDWRRHCTGRYRTAVGNWDLFCIFIETALNLCRPQGWTSLVVPNKLISADYAAPARSLLMENQLLSIRDYSQVPLFSAHVYPLVYVARKAPPWGNAPAASPILYEQMASPDHVAHRHDLALTPDSAQAWLISPPDSATLIHRLCHTFPALSTLAPVTGAATVAEAYGWRSLIQESDRSRPESDCLLFVNSGTLDRYVLLWGHKSLRYLGASYRYPVVPLAHMHHLSPKRQQQAQQPKIIIAGMSRRLECALDAVGSVIPGKSTVVIPLGSPATGLDGRYLLGLLNSRLMQGILVSCFAGNQLKGGYFRIGPRQIRALPIAVSSEPDHPLLSLVDRIMALQQQRLIATCPEQVQHLQEQIAQTDRAIDQSVYQLYGLTEADIRSLDALLTR